MTITPDNLRRALAAHFDQRITPEVASAIFIEAHAAGDHCIDPARFPAQAYKGYTFQVERLRDIRAELHPLHVAHWQETERHRHGLALDPDYDAALGDERAGRLVQFTVRTDAGELVGNLRLYLCTSRHTRTLFSQEDTFYILPGHRGGFLALRALQFAEACMRQLEVQEMRFDAKTVNHAGVLLERLGYRQVSTSYVKILKGEPDVL